MIPKDFFFISTWISVGSAAISLVSGIVLLKYQSTIFKYLIALVFFSVLADIVSWLLIVNNFGTNQHIIKFYNLIQFLLVSTIYFTYNKRRTIRIIILAAVAIYISSFILIHLQNNIFDPASFPRYFSSLSFIIFSILTYYELLQRNEKNILNNSVFWINTTIFLFFSGNFIYYLLRQFLMDEGYLEFIVYLMIFHNLLALAKNLMFVYIFYLNYRNSKTQVIDARL